MTSSIYRRISRDFPADFVPISPAYHVTYRLLVLVFFSDSSGKYEYIHPDPVSHGPRHFVVAGCFELRCILFGFVIQNANVIVFIV